MSSKGRKRADGNGGEPLKLDDYPTPGWCVDRLMESIGSNVPRGGRWLEPSAGGGRIIERVNRYVDGIEWHAWEIQDRYAPRLRELAADVRVVDMLIHGAKSSRPGRRWSYDLAITNPPYSIAFPMLLLLRQLAPVVVLLLRRNFVGSESRHDYLQTNMPDEYCLPNRPKFVMGRSDSCEYAWMIWHSLSGTKGSTRMLGLTSLKERRRWERQGYTWTPDPPAMVAP